MTEHDKLYHIVVEADERLTIMMNAFFAVDYALGGMGLLTPCMERDSWGAELTLCRDRIMAVMGERFPLSLEKPE